MERIREIAALSLGGARPQSTKHAYYAAKYTSIARSAADAQPTREAGYINEADMYHVHIPSSQTTFRRWVPVPTLQGVSK